MYVLYEKQSISYLLPGLKKGGLWFENSGKKELHAIQLKISNMADIICTILVKYKIARKRQLSRFQGN